LIFKILKFLLKVIYVYFKNRNLIFQHIFGSDTHICVDSPLPHTFMNDIIVCYDQKNKKFHSTTEILSKFSKKSIKYVPKDDKIWYIFIANSTNHTLKPNKLPNGFLTMHMRHLKCAGYTPILVRNISVSASPPLHLSLYFSLITYFT
jgi:hypothetical protein